MTRLRDCARLLFARVLCAFLAAVLGISGITAAPASAIDNWGIVDTDVDDSSNLLVGGLSSASSADGSTVIAVYRHLSSSRLQISYAVGTVDGNVQTWGNRGAVAVAVTESGNPERPQVAISADGTKATAIWSLDAQVFSASATITGGVATWGTPALVGDGGPTKRIALSKDGTRAFSLSLNGSSSIHANYAVIDGTTQTWGTSTAIGSSGRAVNSPIATLAADGLSGTSLWTERNSVSTDPWNLTSRAFTISGGTVTWGDITPATPVHDTNSSVWYPSAVASYDGNRISAVWQKTFSGTSHEVESSSATVSGTTVTWGSPTMLDSFSGANRNAYADVAGSADGKAVTAMWSDGATGAQVLYANSGTVDGSTQTWGTRQTVGSIKNQNEYKLKVKTSQDGRIAVAGYLDDRKVKSVTGHIDGTSNTWAEPQELASTNNTFEMTLGLSIDGLRATLVWERTLGTVQSVSGGTATPAPTVSAIAPNSGSITGGETVKITGTNLYFATSVTIGGQACTDLHWVPMEQHLTCKVPARQQAGAVDVVVTTTTGSAIVAGGYTYTGGGGGEPTHVPNKPRELAVSGTPVSKKFKIKWVKPTLTAEGRPVERYRLIIIQKGPRKLILKKALPSSRTSYTVTRKFLLKHSVRSRGDVVAQELRYRVRVEGFNTLGGGPVATTHLKIRL